MVLFSALARAFRTPHSVGVMRSNAALFSGVFVGIFLAIIFFKTSLLSEWPRGLRGELMGTECSKTIACSAGLSCKNGNCVSPAEACYQIAIEYDQVTLDGSPIASYGHPWIDPFFGSPCIGVDDNPGCAHNTYQTFTFPFTVAKDGVACVNVVFDNFFSDLKLDGNTILSVTESPRMLREWNSSIIVSPQNDDSLMNGTIQDLFVETTNYNYICLNVTVGSHTFEVTGSNGTSLSYWGASIVDTCTNPPPVAASPAEATTVCGSGCSEACVPTTNLCGSGCSTICVLPSSSSSISSSDSSSIASSDFSSSSSEIMSSESSSFSASSVSESSSDSSVSSSVSLSSSDMTSSLSQSAASSVSESSSLSSSEISSISSSASESISSLASSILSSSISSSIESSLPLSSSAISLLSSISSSVSSSEVSSSSSSVIASSSASSLTSISSSVAVSATSSSVSSSGSSLSSSLSSSRVPKPVGTIASVSSSGIEGFDPWNPWGELPATFSYPSSEYAATVPAPEPVAWHWPDDPFSSSSVAPVAVDIPNPSDTENSEIFHGAAPSVQSSVSSLNERQNSCGDGIVQAADGEECDDNNGNSGDGCSVLCLQERGFCGDGVLQYGLGEQCDAGKANGQPQADCDSHCAYVRLPSCGDGVVDPATELCDEGAENGDPGSSCRANCILPRCGDGIQDVNEQCDDGNNLDKDTCTSSCKIPVRATTITGKPSAPLPPMQAALIREVPRTIPTPARTATGPGLVIFLVTGAAAGIGLMRRRL